MCLVQWNLGSIKYMATKHCFASNSVHKTWRNSNNNTASVPITDNIGSTQFLLNISNLILANLKSNIFWVYVYLTMRLYIGIILYIDTDTMRLVLFVILSLVVFMAHDIVDWRNYIEWVRPHLFLHIISRAWKRTGACCHVKAPKRHRFPEVAKHFPATLSKPLHNNYCFMLP